MRHFSNSKNTEANFLILRQKKLSIPNTVSRVLKYIPELQNEIERLVRKKEALSVKISKQGELFQYENQRNNSIRGNLATVSASLIGDKQVTIQLSTFKANMRLQSEALEVVEKDGFELVNASFNSFGERAFYNLHLQVFSGSTLYTNLLSVQVLVTYLL